MKKVALLADKCSKRGRLKFGVASQNKASDFTSQAKENGSKNYQLNCN